MNLKIVVSNPTVPEAKNLTKEDVWGKWENHVRVSNGMLVAQGYGPVSDYFTQSDKDKLTAIIPEICPIWNDVLGYKSVTVICLPCQEEEVRYWLEYVHGGNSVRGRKLIRGEAYGFQAGELVALRSAYQCW